MTLQKSKRRMLAICRVALGNLCLLALLMSNRPLLTGDSVGTTAPSESNEVYTESVIGTSNRLVRVRLLWASTAYLPPEFGYVLPKQQIPAPVVGHSLSHELLAPLRC